MIKVIKSEKEHETALAEISSLIDRDPDPGTPDADRLEARSKRVISRRKRTLTSSRNPFSPKLFAVNLWPRMNMTSVRRFCSNALELRGRPSLFIRNSLG